MSVRSAIPGGLRALAGALIAVALLASCSRAETAATPAGPAGAPAVELRLGYFPNVTHASAIVGLEKGLFAAELGSTTLTTQTFNAGGDEVNALLGGSLDAGFIGSGPAINAFSKSGGDAVRLISGATDGGAALVVRPGITGPDQLRGRTLATPQKGNTQDIALKKWLAGQKLTIGDGPTDVHVANLDNPRTLDAFKQGSVDGGWLPEPWSSRLELEAGAKVLLDERTVWPGGKFPTTVLVVRTDYLAQHPDTVRALLRGHLKAVDLVAADPAGARAVVNASLEKLTGKPLPDAVIDQAFQDIRLDVDPLAATFPQLAADSVTAGITTTPANLAGFLDLGPLNAVLAAAGRPPADAAGLDKAKG